MRQRVRPSSRIPGKELPNYGGDHWEVQRWFDRLPLWLFEEAKRERVLKALDKAAADFEALAASEK